MLSIQQADQIAREALQWLDEEAAIVSRKYNLPLPNPVSNLPPIYVTSKLPSQYAGAYYHNGDEQIKIRPEYLSERTLIHEIGHLYYRTRVPANHQTNTESEEMARWIEKRWIYDRKNQRKLIDGKSVGQVLAFTLDRRMTVDEAKRVAHTLRQSEIGESIDRIGFKDRYFYVVMKPIDGIVIAPFIPIIVAALGLVGIGVVAWTTPLLQPGPLGLPNVVWILVAGTALLVAVAWAVGRLRK